MVCKADDGTKTNGQDTSTGSGKKSSKPPACTYEKMEPQPPAGSAYRLGHAADEKGAIYIQTCTLTREGGTGTMNDQKLVWIADGQKTPAVDPATVAQMAAAKMKLLGPQIANPRAAGQYVVGMPMWMWLEQTPTTYGPQTTSATAGGVTVTATAKVSSVSWAMGDGTQAVVCTGPGTKYTPSMGKAQSPDCGHVYTKASSEEAGGKFHGTATATWTVDWQVAGDPAATGQFTEQRQTAFTTAVREVQVLN
ncbi:ATP/GTP-binding protein [Streptomyces sasae]|uniref:ATP/GTP-binding protein n=1 Tax=Streptomyces sasae TaxID=1266772 RepID=UPI0029312390|nr:ATP/GTP-binding protein [Streptomyces sasae]